MNKTFRILEIVWLCLAGIGIVMCCYAFITQDNRGGVYFLAFTFVSGIMYWVRKKQRIRFESTQQKKDK